MKFLFSKDIRDQPHIRLSLIFYLTGVMVFWSLHWFHEHYTFGLLPSTLIQTLRGNPEQFLRPLASAELVLEMHIRLFLYVVTLLTVSAVFFRLPLSAKAKSRWAIATHTFLLLNLLALVLTRYVAVEFSWIKCGAFIGFQMSLAYMAFLCLLFLCRPKGSL